MDAIDALEQSWARGAELVAGLDASALDRPTSCADWDVRALLNHTLGEAQMMTLVNRGEQSGNDHGDLVGDGSDLARVWNGIAEENVESWRRSGLDGDRTYFYGTFPARACVVINLGEVLVHGWDLAQATGQDAALEQVLVEPVYGLYANYPLDGMRAGGMLGPEVPVPADAAVADRLLGLLGRKP